ncbi:MAG: YHS domain-containing protein, partial [Acidimicrobiales bacterium]
DTIDDSRLTSSLVVFDASVFRNVNQTNASREITTDPVCGMTIDAATATVTRQLDGQEYPFCSTVCAETFDRHAERYHRSNPA